MRGIGAVRGVLGNGTELIKEGPSAEVTLELMRIGQSCQMPGFFFLFIICCHTRAFGVLII